MNSKPPLAIRPERPDHPQVVALLAELDAYLAGLYEPEANHILSLQELLAPEVRFLAAWHGSVLVGCGAVRSMPGDAATQGERYVEVKRMMVLPAARGQGVAAALLAALEEAVRGQGISLAMLETGTLQTNAVRLYERGGYALRPAFGGYPDNGLSLFYAKRLQP